jgi:hypothetical protein
MKLGLVASTAVAAVMFLSSSAQAVVVDYSNLTGVGNGGAVTNYGSSAEAEVTYSTLGGIVGFGNNNSVLYSSAAYWNIANYSGDKAIYSVTDGNILQVKLDAASGSNITSLALNLGAYPDENQSINYRVFDGAFNQLFSGTGLFVSGTTGAVLNFALNSSTVIFQMGTDWNVGINQLTYETSNVAAVPIPGALLLFGTAVAGLAGAARRRRKQAA